MRLSDSDKAMLSGQWAIPNATQWMDSCSLEMLSQRQGTDQSESI